MQNTIQNTIQNSINNITDSLKLVPQLEIAGKILVNAINNGNKILICGNGGSAADSQHMAAEIIGRFEVERRAFPAIALNTDTSILTAVGNDYGFNDIFSRQVQGLGNAGDVLIGISTSGNSKNVVQAIHVAKQKNMVIIGFCGKNGGQMQELLAEQPHINLCATGANTARIQEVHGIWIHALCELIDIHCKA
ncbi:MAG: phosphoheptose isomerase [Pseudomonadota bacterium]|jgi:D-sedoheptulose 7-phosphate isomerase